MSNQVEAFPLAWPSGYPRCLERKKARFKISLAVARDGIFKELRLMKATQVVMSTNVPLKQNGSPYGSQGLISDPGVAVYFFRKDKQLVLACDEWARIEDNLHAVQLSISAMRGLDRWGCSDILDRAFTGFTALPPPSLKREWWDVLQCRQDSSLDVINFNYKRLAKDYHPDLGCSNEKMYELNRAIADARKERRK